MAENESIISQENLEFGKRVDIIAKETGLTLNQISKQVGTSATAITNARNGVKPFGKKVAKAIEEKLGYSVEWILFGRGIKHTSVQEGGTSINNLPLHNLTAPLVYAGELPGYLVPFVSIRARLGFDYQTFIESIKNETHEMIRVFSIPGNKNAVVIEVDGDNLGPILISSTKVLALEVEPLDYPRQSSGLYAIATKNELMLKRIIENKLKNENVLVLASDENGRGKIEIDGRDIKAIWKASEIVSRPID